MTLIISVPNLSPTPAWASKLLGCILLPAQLWGFLRALMREEILSLLSLQRAKVSGHSQPSTSTAWKFGIKTQTGI